MDLTFSIAIPSFEGSHRVDALLLSIDRFSKWDGEIVVCEDKSPRPQPIEDPYRIVIAKWKQRFPGLRLVKLKEWGNMQGASQKAVEQCSGDIIIYLSDDTIISQNTLEYITYFWTHNDIERLHCGLQRIAVRNACDIPGLREQFYSIPLLAWHDNSFTPDVERPHICPGVHGSGFVVRKDVFKEVGGFNPNFLMLDEDLSVRVMTKTDQVSYALPNPALLHYGAAAQAGSHGVVDTVNHYEECEKAWGLKRELFWTHLGGILDERMRVYDLRKYIEQDLLDLM